MASRKRSRNTTDVDGEVEIESASSSFRRTIPHKRSRVALAAEQGGSVVSDDDDEIEQYELNDDIAMQHSDEEEEGNELEELVNTQYVEKQLREKRDNIASDQGVIEEVICINFMCHSRLRIALGPLINFIIGHNGSGKSAVLTALTMCLGGSARNTNRGASLKTMIKEGEDHASLSVKIKNQKDGAYKPELYGRSITVERHFSRNNTSGFKLKNDQDKCVSTKKADLDDILDFFAFQLDNPINVLTQDNARQFLSNSSSADKYKFFIRGTQLEALDNDYKLMEDHLDQTESKLATRETDIVALKQKMDEAERRKKKSERGEKIQENIRRTQWMHAWAQVEEQEAILVECETAVVTAEEEMHQQEQDAEAVSGTYDGHNQAFEAAERSLAQFNEMIEPITQQHVDAKKAFDDNTQKLKNILAQSRDMKSEKRGIERDITACTEKVQDEQRRLAEAEGGEHTARVVRLEELKAAAVESKSKQTEHGVGFADLQRKLDAAKQAVELQKPELSAKQQLHSEEQNRLQKLRRDKQGPYDAYRGGPNGPMKRLIVAINGETRWHKKPVGPMGVHVQLLKPQWHGVFEKTFGKALEGFVVVNEADRRLLVGLLKRTQCDSTIYIGRPEPLDTTGKEPSPDVDTMMRALRIDNDMVRNQLIINTAIEQTVLIEDRQQCQTYMSRHPNNVRAGLCLQLGSNSVCGFRYDFSTSGADKSNPIQKWTGGSRMKTDREDQIRILEQAVNDASREVHTAEQNARARIATRTEADQALNRFRRRQGELRVAVQTADDSVADLEGEIESLRPQDGKLQELEKQLADHQEALDSIIRQGEDAALARVDRSAEGATLKHALDAAGLELEGATARIKQAEDRFEKLRLARQKALHDKNESLEHVKARKQDIEKLQEKREQQRTSVQEDYVAAAENICARINVEKGITPQMLDDRLEKFYAEAARLVRDVGGTREQLVAAYTEAHRNWSTAQTEASGMIRFAKVRLLHNPHLRCYGIDNMRRNSKTP